MTFIDWHVKGNTGTAFVVKKDRFLLTFNEGGDWKGFTFTVSWNWINKGPFFYFSFYPWKRRLLFRKGKFEWADILL